MSELSPPRITSVNVQPGDKISCGNLLRGSGSGDRGAARTARERRMRPLVRWEGPLGELSSIGLVNRELTSALSATAAVDIELPGDHGDRAPDIVVRHRWPPSFRPPDQGRLVLILPWEYGYLPADWVAPLTS
jgi:hypothetical protein